MSVSTADRIHGLLLAGAVGDALGAPVEFDSIETIREQLGPQGVSEVLAPGHFTDDTQMMLFTCEALLISGVLLERDERCNPLAQLHHAYLRWLATQGAPLPFVALDPMEPLGWLLDQPALHRVEAPGSTCLSALSSGVCGTPTRPLNDSKGCGGVMRAAPAGFLVPGIPPGASLPEAYHLGREIATVTHGHREGIDSAGALGAIIAGLFGGATLEDAVRASITLSSPVVAAYLQRAVRLAKRGVPRGEDLEAELGGGWVGEEALAIAVACALSTDELDVALLASVNHSGDSDSTGAICGNIVGARDGIDALAPEWIAAVDHGDLVTQMARDCSEWLAFHMEDGATLSDEWLRRYTSLE